MERLPYRVLTNVRPWNYKYFDYITGKLFDPDSVFRLSNERGVGEFDYVTRFYRHFRRQTTRPDCIDAAEVNEIKLRCRLLRSIDSDQAERMIYATALTLEEALDRSVPDFVFSLTVDAYMPHTLMYQARRRGIPFYGLCPIVINGFHMITGVGEHQTFRTPTEVEKNRVLKMLTEENYKTHYLPLELNAFVPFRRWMKESAKAIYFGARRRLGTDRLNYHAWVNEMMCARRASPAFLFPNRFFDDEWESKVAKGKGPLIYLPLQYHPECNSEYWPNKDFMDYENSVLEVLRRMPSDVRVMVKEHPNFLGFRSTKYYRALRAIKQVIFVPPYIRSERLIEMSEVAMTWCSSVGIEAPLRGKPVVCFGSPYFAKGRMYFNIADRRGLKDVVDIVRTAARTSAVTPFEQGEIIGHVLSGCLPGDAMETYFDPNNALKKRSADSIVDSMHGNLSPWLDWHRQRRENSI